MAIIQVTPLQYAGYGVALLGLNLHKEYKKNPVHTCIFTYIHTNIHTHIRKLSNFCFTIPF